MVSDRSSVHHQEFFTVHTAIHTSLLTACEQDQDGQRNCPKHVEFYSKNKFEKLVHLVGFVVRKYIYIYIYILWLSYLIFITLISNFAGNLAQ